MSADSEKPNIIGGNWTKYCTAAKFVGRGRPIWKSVVVRARARVACALWPVQSIPVAIFLNQDAQSALRKRRVFDFVPSYLKDHNNGNHFLAFEIDSRVAACTCICTSNERSKVALQVKCSWSATSPRLTQLIPTPCIVAVKITWACRGKVCSHM